MGIILFFWGFLKQIQDYKTPASPPIAAEASGGGRNPSELAEISVGCSRHTRGVLGVLGVFLVVLEDSGFWVFFGVFGGLLGFCCFFWGFWMIFVGDSFNDGALFCGSQVFVCLVMFIVFSLGTSGVLLGGGLI